MAESWILRNASRWGDIDIVREQIKAGDDVNKTAPGYNRTPLQLSIRRGHIDTHTPLQLSAVHGHTDIVKALIEAGADVNKTAPGYNRTPLHISTYYGHTDISKVLIEAGADVNVKNDDNDTPLHFFTKGGHNDIVKALIEAKADVNVKNDDNDTPLHLSLKGGHTVIAKALIEAGADVNVKNDDNDTPLHLSAEGGHTDIVNALIEAGADVNVKNDDNETPLHLSAEGGHTAIVNALIEAKAKMNESNNQGLKPVLLAALYGHTKIIKMLFSAGAMLDMDDKKEMTSMFTILMETDHNVMSVVLSDSLLCNARGDFNWTILHEAASLGCRDHIKNLLGRPGIDKVPKDDFDRTPLHCASEIGKQEIVNDLIDAGCDVFSMNSSGQSCLHIAFIYGHSELVELFIGKGLDPCQTDKYKRNCLHYAVLYRREDVIHKLLTAKSMSSYNKRDCYRKLPIDYLNDCERVSLISRILRQKDTNIEIKPLGDASSCSVQKSRCPNTSVILNRPYIGLVKAIKRHRVSKFVAYVKSVVEMVIHKAIPCITVEIISVGSSAEGTKNGLPDEFDFIIRLYSVDSKTSEEKEGFRKMERNEAKVKELNIIGSYGIWLWDLLMKFWCTCQEQGDIKLRKPSETTRSLFKRDKYFKMPLPPQRHPDHKTCTTWVWLYTGGIFKNLPVSIDFVPAIETEVDTARTRSTWMMNRDDLAQKFCFIVPKMPHESSSLGKDFNQDDVYQLGRVSYPTLEVEHLQTRDKRVQDVYSTAKCLRKPEICGFKIRDEKESVKPAGDFVTSYHLKTVFLHLVKVFLNTKMSLGKMVLMVYEHLERCLKREELPMFFEQEVNVLAGSRLNVKDSLVVAGMMKTFARSLYERDFPSEIESDTAEEKRILAEEQENYEKKEETYIKLMKEYELRLKQRKLAEEQKIHEKEEDTDTEDEYSDFEDRKPRKPEKPIIPLYLRQ